MPDPRAPGAVEPEPAVAAELFGDHIEAARAFTSHLAERGELLGLIGPLEPPRLWTRHILNCALIAPLLWNSGRVADVGSGAGLPGMVLAIARPDVRFVLIEPMERRVDWLLSETADLGLTNVEVVRARAEEVKDAQLSDQVTARAVSSLTKLLPLVVPLARSGGQVVLMKGANVDAELAAASKVVRRLGLRDAEVMTVGDGAAIESTRVFRATVG